MMDEGWEMIPLESDLHKSDLVINQHIMQIDRILTYSTLLDVLWQMYHPWITYGTVRMIV